MPSHSVKQAKVMSAIAHGWKPKGKVARIPLKVAKEFHAADAGHKYGKGMARGGDIDEPSDLSNKGQVPRSLQPWVIHLPRTYPGMEKIMPPMPLPKGYDDGGSVDDLPDVGPPLLSPGPRISEGTSWGNKAADIGSKLGYALIRNPYDVGANYIRDTVNAAKQPLGSDEYHAAIGDVGRSTGDLALSMMGRKAPTGEHGVFVGPYGAMMLREQGYREPHPVMAEKMERQLSQLPEDQRGIVRDQMTSLADIAGQANIRAGRDPQETFREYGWSRGSDTLPRKEIPDTGASLVKNPDGEGYLLKHPAGDFHKLYDIPPIKFDPKIKAGDAAFNLRTNEIVVGGKATKENQEKMMPQVLHEVQHAIQKKEGFSIGDNPDRFHPGIDVFDQEYAPKGVPLPSWQQQKIKEQMIAQGMDPESNPGTFERAMESARNRKGLAAFNAYKRSAGETEARNVMDRYSNPERYHEYPEFTEDIPRGLQHNLTYEELMNPPVKPIPPHEPYGGAAPPRESGPYPQSTPEAFRGLGARNYRRNSKGDRVNEYGFTRDGYYRGYASGGNVGGFNPERSEAYSLQRQGMLHSPVPGRTDKLNLNVPTGSYIIPADIPSAIGEGNSIAGGNILNKMFAKGPYGMALSKTKGPRTHARKSSLSAIRFASGGVNSGRGTAPIVAAGGEYVVHPDTVAQLGNGDLSLGHSILDSFVKQIRQKHIATLKKLKPPKGSK